jgi:F420H(2)-dependent quinone reductase
MTVAGSNVALMDERVQLALARGGVIDITTTGRQSGLPRRLEIVLHSIGGRWFISGKPGWPRDWIANLRANSRMVVHLKRGVVADLPARGRVITDRAEREAILPPIAEGWGYPLAVMVTGSPLIEVTFE